jgi:hypothetical protein
MRTWSLKAGDPCAMVLSADFRFCEPDYLNDHNWEIKSGTGDSNTLEVQTTYGLRARSMRIFPSFKLDKKNVTNPEKFASPPRLMHFFPNFLQFSFSPFQGVNISAEYWLPSSQTLACRMSFHNQTTKTLDLQYEVCGMLIPIEGQSLAASSLQSVNVLAGKTSDLEPVVFLTGGPLHGPGPNTSLLLDVKLSPLASRNFTWVQAALTDTQASFDLARHTAARPWDAEKARILLTNAAQIVDIETGDPDWDAAMAFSQVTALRLFFNASDHMPNPSFVLARQPDHGYSAREDGREHGSLWSGQNVHDVFFMTNLLPGTPELAAGLLRNFLSTQDEAGFVDCQPGLVGQRGRWLAAPLLASLALKIYQQTGDKEFLREVFPKLLSFLKLWFDPKHDRDGDGFPEWDHPVQTGFEDNPVFNSLYQGVDIRFFEDPSLAASLYRESKCLITLAGEMDIPGESESLKNWADSMLFNIKQCWNKSTSFYQNRDRDTHLRLKTKPILKHPGSGEFKVNKEFRQPVRLVFQVSGNSRDSRSVNVHIQGKTSNQPVIENLSRSDFRWEQDTGVATSQLVYNSVDVIEVTGLTQNNRLVVRSVDYVQEDQTGFLPLWAGIPGENEAEELINQKLLDPQTFWHPAGISTIGLSNKPQQVLEDMLVQFPWNNFIGEGLLTYDKRSEASILVTRMIQTTIGSLKQDGAFYNSYRAKEGTGFGERNSLHGLVPVGLFLRTLGVQIISAQSVRLEGINPFPWPVTVKYRGLTIIRNGGVTDITFPDGQTTRVTDTAVCLVSNEQARSQI